MVAFAPPVQGELCRSAVQFSSSHDAYVASTLDSIKREADFIISTETVAPWEDVRKTTCWHMIFMSSCVAFGFVISDRPDFALGSIELPFDLMLHLAGIKCPLTHRNRIVLKGFSTALIPVKHDGDSVLWHLIATKSKEQSLKLEDIQEYMVGKDSLPIADLESLRSARTFLGYAAKSLVTLGTLDSGFDKITVSNAEPQGSQLSITEVSLEIGSSGMGFFGFNVIPKFKLTPGLRGNIRSHPLSDNDRLTRSMNQPILLYDVTAKNAWLVPELCVIFHMLHSWASDSATTKPENEIPHAEQIADGAQAVRMVIENSASLPLERQLDGSSISLGQKLITYLEVIEARKDEAFLNRPEGRHRNLWRLTLLGWEYMDLVKYKQFPRRKVIDIGSNLFKDKTWPQILTQGPDILTIFANNLGTPIIPAEDSVCIHCTRSMDGKNHLRATIRTLLHISMSEFGIGQSSAFLRLSHEAYWQASYPDPFRDCPPRGPDCPKRVQYLSQKRPCDENRATIEQYIDGAIAIGCYGRMAK